MKRTKSLWPLPGGVKNYVQTLRSILMKVRESNPSEEELVDWMMREYKLEGRSAVGGYVRVVYSELGLLEKRNNRFFLTRQSEEFLKTGDNRIILDCMRGIVGVDEIFSILSKYDRLDLKKIHSELNESLHLGWKLDAQTRNRLNWLWSLGYIDFNKKYYYLTDAGKEIIKEIEESQIGAPAPPTFPKEPVPSIIPEEKKSKLFQAIKNHSEYVNRIILEHPKMSEADTMSVLIEPLLETLGWNIRNPGEVQRNYPIEWGTRSGRVDIALKIENSPVLFIEVKPAHLELNDDQAKQALDYAFYGNVDWCALTNGKEYRVYNSRWKYTGIAQRMFFRILIENFEENFELIQLLSKDSIPKGKLNEEGQWEYSRRKISEWLEQKQDFIANSVCNLDPSLNKEHIKRVLKDLTAYLSVKIKS